jgi:HAD superfamily hydrolase (TIGR01458 family)
MRFKGAIFDVDGVLEYHGRALPGAGETIARLREMGVVLRFLTNSTLKSRASCASQLERRGIRAAPGEVITASYSAAEYVRSLRPRSCWVMLEREGLTEFGGIPIDEEKPEYIVVGDNRSRFDFEHLNKALRHLAAGSKLVGMQSELLDTSMGALELNVGSWVGMLERASGVRAVYTGKPDAYAFELALGSMKLAKTEVAMVGDKVSTDVRGAKDFGIASILVTTGEYDPSELAVHPSPDFVVRSVADVADVFAGEKGGTGGP